MRDRTSVARDIAPAAISDELGSALVNQPFNRWRYLRDDGGFVASGGLCGRSSNNISQNQINYIRS
jgi:hypothetical protein